MRLLLVILALLAGTTQAAVISWTLQDGLLSDGQTVDGGFHYDTDTGQFTNVTLSSSGGGFHPQTDFANIMPGLNDCTTGCMFTPDNPQAGDLALIIYGPDEASPGNHDLSYGLSAFDTCQTAGCTFIFSFGEHPTWVDGTLVGVDISTIPIPAAIWLFSSALAGLGWMRRKQTV